MDLTVGKIEDMLRKYSKGTLVHIGCRHCHHSSIGDEGILKLNDCTDQTYGYIELQVNETYEPNNEEITTSEEKEFFVKEIGRLKEEIKDKDRLIQEYTEEFKNIQSKINSSINWTERIKKGEMLEY